MNRPGTNQAIRWYTTSKAKGDLKGYFRPPNLSTVRFVTLYKISVAIAPVHTNPAKKK